ncbi:MAG: putative Ig domain-containing protein, partial [Bacteroidota bacterium]
MGVFAPTTANPITAYGWYEEGKSNQLQEVGTIDNSNDRTLNVTTQGGTSFDPGSVSFGLYTRWPVFDNRLVFTEDELNTFNPDNNHHVRIYPIPNEPNAYLIGVEEFTRGYDFQDIVYVVRNVEPVDGAVIALENMTKIPGLSYGFPADDFYAFSNIDPQFVGYHQFKDKNTIRISNSGITPLVINQINISDLNFFTLPNNDVLPISIAPGAFYDLEVQFVDNSGDKGIKTATIELVSNAQNTPNLVATLSGGHSDQPEGGNELSPQQVMNTFGFLTNTNGLPDSDYPTPEEVAAGIHGDIVVSEYFVQADPSQPVVAFRLANYNARNSPTVKLIDANGSTVGGITFRTDPDWHNTILPLDLEGGKISSDFANTINVPFRISMAGYTTSGRNGINANTGLPNDLGVRVYKVIDRDGNIIPNHYIAIHDYVGGGCVATTGEASCDWNDNIAYLVNVRPQALPSASLIGDLMLTANESFSLNISNSFNPGYSGNSLSFQAQLSNGDPLPSWLNFDAAAGLFSGTAPTVQEATFAITITATDENGNQVQASFNILVGNDTPLSCTASGELDYKIWTGISGSSINDLLNNANYPDSPSETQVLTNFFEGRTNFADNYGSQITGILCVPQSGNYTFWISGDNDSELWLSSDENPANAQRIAFVPGWSNSRQWTKFPEQESAPINLISGKKYYIYALQKEAGGGDNLAVGWQLPNNTLERPIPAAYFSRPGQQIAPTLSLNPTALSFESTAGNADITVTSNTQWMANTTADWISINPENGNGDGTFQVSVSEHTGENARQADITVTAGALNETITVSQSGVPVVANCTAEGTLQYEIWTGITGLNVSDLTTSPNYPDNPSE